MTTPDRPPAGYAGGRLAQPLTPWSNHMTDQPTSDPTHGLSVQHADALWDAVAIPGPTTPTFPMQHERVCRAVAEIIDEVAPAVPVVPVSSPPPDQTALERIRAIHQPVAGEGDTKWCQVCSQEERQPQPIGWWVPWPCPTVQAVNEAHTETQAHPPQYSWRVETRDPLADQWAPGSRFAHRPAAVERWETANRTAPLWRDGTPVERRIVRETTTYTVEEPPPVHKGGNADDCPACIAGGLDTIGPPYECPGGETAGEGGRPD